MARKLPWVKQDSGQRLKTSSVALSRSNLRSETEQSCIEDDIHREEACRSGTNKRKRSASPALIPPKLEHMRTGLRQDDGWVMVEDELYDVARSFTAHLHRAEYEKLMSVPGSRKGIDYNSTKSYNPTLHSRPERRRVIEKKLLNDRQQSGLNRVSTIGFSDSDEDDLVQNAEATLADLWAGTSLASLMKNNNRGKVSLQGLDILKSYSRAEKGLTAVGKASRVESTTGELSTRAGKNTSTLPGDELQERKFSNTQRAAKTQIAQPVPSPSQQMSNTTRSSVTKSRIRSFIEKLDDFDVQPKADTSTKQSRSMPAKRTEDGIRFQNDDLDDVPVFL